MGFIRGSLFVVVCVLLFLSLLVLGTLLTLSLSLNYDNVQEEINPLIQSVASNLDDVANDTLVMMQFHCQNSTDTDYVFSYQDTVISVPCSVSQEGAEAVADEIVNDFIYDFYYKEYDCVFWSCFSEEEAPLFLISEKANDYWQEKVYFALFFSLLFVVLLYLLVEQKLNWLIFVGSILILSAFVLLKIPDFISFLIPDVLGLVSVLIDIFFGKINTVFSIILIFGIITLAGGITLRIFGYDSIKKKFSKEDVRKIVKKEMADKKETVKKKK